MPATQERKKEMITVRQVEEIDFVLPQSKELMKTYKLSEAMVDKNKIAAYAKEIFAAAKGDKKQMVEFLLSMKSPVVRNELAEALDVVEFAGKKGPYSDEYIFVKGLANNMLPASVAKEYVGLFK
jgi:hypothetical protein